MKGRVTILAVLSLIFMLAPAAKAQSVPDYQAIPNYFGIGAGEQFRIDINNHLSGVTPIAPRLVKVLYSQLPPERDGQEFYLLDGVPGNPCTGGGFGAYAFGIQGQWVCSGTAVTNALLETAAACAGPPTIGNLLAVNGSGNWCDTSTPAIAAATLNPGAAQSAITANLHSGASAPLAVLGDANANSAQTLLQVNTAGHSGVCSMIEQSDGTVTFTCSKLVATGNATVGGTLGVTGAATIGGTLGVTGALTWNAGAPDLSELNAPRVEVRDVDYPSLFNDTNELFGSMKAAVAVTVRKARVFTELAAGTCSLAPSYTLCTGATLGTCTTAIASNCGPPSGTAIGASDCATTATSVPAGNYIFWLDADTGTSCAGKFAQEYEYTVN